MENRTLNLDLNNRLCFTNTANNKWSGRGKSTGECQKKRTCSSHACDSPLLLLLLLSLSLYVRVSICRASRLEIFLIVYHHLVSLTLFFLSLPVTSETKAQASYGERERARTSRGDPSFSFFLLVVFFSSSESFIHNLFLSLLLAFHPLPPSLSVVVNKILAGSDKERSNPTSHRLFWLWCQDMYKRLAELNQDIYRMTMVIQWDKENDSSCLWYAGRQEKIFFRSRRRRGRRWWWWCQPSWNV